MIEKIINDPTTTISFRAGGLFRGVHFKDEPVRDSIITSRLDRKSNGGRIKATSASQGKRITRAASDNEIYVLTNNLQSRRRIANFIDTRLHALLISGCLTHRAE